VKKIPQILISIGIFFIAASAILLILIFLPVANVEINYNLNNSQNTIRQIIPVDKDFGIVIPKISANAKVIPQVDPYNSRIYQVALTKGVAHAKGTALPDQIGNMFIFSHSSVNLLDATRYNSVFFLLSKLKNNDEIDIYYKGSKYKYQVEEIKTVDAKDVSYLNPNSKTQTLILMTCWPAGTNYKRLLVIAKLV
jgi:LPXTG-site transpeptidase (sortase) family protein